MPPKAGSAIPYDLLMAIQQGTMAYRYKGRPLLKNPFDLALYPLLLADARPRTLIEIGSFQGGSALWFADQAAGLGWDLEVHSVDVAPPSGIERPHVHFHPGDGRRLGDVFDRPALAALPRPWLVIDDADHQYETTLAVLRFFDPLMAPGEYIVIEDGILTDMRVADAYGGGPARAIHDFLADARGRFEIDRSYCDYFGHNVTWNVDGYLRRLP
jgi:cephalosporin hydroxylase